MTETVPRCEVCGWPLSQFVTDGCVPGNCSCRSIPHCFICDKPKGHPPDRCNGHYMSTPGEVKPPPVREPEPFDPMLDAFTAMQARAEAAEAAIKFARQYQGHEARACPLCIYQAGVFIRHCSLHQQIERAEARAAALELALREIECSKPVGNFNTGESYPCFAARLQGIAIRALRDHAGSLAEHDAEVRKAALLEAAGEAESKNPVSRTWPEVAGWLRKLAEESQP